MDNNPEITHGTPPSPAAPKPEIPVVEDPVRFMNDFETSTYFQSAYDKYFEGKTLAPDVTDDEKYAAFSEDETAKLALLDFAENEERFKYNPSYFPQPVRDALNDYVEQTRDMAKMMGGASQDEIISADRQRSSYHDKAARMLKEAGLVGSQRLGKAFARLVLISRGLDHFESARQSDLERLKRFLNAR